MKKISLIMIGALILANGAIAAPDGAVIEMPTPGMPGAKPMPGANGGGTRDMFIASMTDEERECFALAIADCPEMPRQNHGGAGPKHDHEKSIEADAALDARSDIVAPTMAELMDGKTDTPAGERKVVARGIPQTGAPDFGANEWGDRNGEWKMLWTPTGEMPEMSTDAHAAIDCKKQALATCFIDINDLRERVQNAAPKPSATALSEVPADQNFVMPPKGKKSPRQK